MKKCSSKFLAAVLAVICAVCSPVWADVAIDEANFPDEVFREYVSGLDKNNDGSLSDSEIAAVTVIDVHKKEYYYYYDFEESEDKISSLIRRNRFRLNQKYMNLITLMKMLLFS